MSAPRGGFAGRILLVDLSRRTVATEPLEWDDAERFVGGLGLCVKIAHGHVRPGTDALSPRNPIVLGAGPLVGTNLPSTSRLFAVAKLPGSGTVGWCGAGGVTFGYQLKCAGFDHVVIEGRADAPVYLSIVDDRVEIRDARPLWGRDVVETCSSLWREAPWPTGVLCIGPAGEQLIPFSMAYINRLATLGRGGLGAVLGSKNLKAIAVQGTGCVKVARPHAYRSLLKGFLQTIREYPYLKEWQEMGLVKSFPVIPMDVYRSIKERRVACVSCPVGCKDVVRIRDGEFAGLAAHSSSILNLFTPMGFGFQDYGEAVRCIRTLDGHGLDMFEFFGLMGMAARLAQRGAISPSDLDVPIATDSLASMEAWAGRIVRREGLGAILAQGFPGLLGAFGKEAEACAPALVKAMHPYAGPGGAVNWHYFGTMELGQALDPRGPHVAAGGSPTYFSRRPLDVFPRHLRRMGVPEEALERILPGLGSAQASPQLKIGRLLKYSHRWFCILGALGVCARAQVNRFYNARLCTDLYGAVTGIDANLDGIRQGADRGWTLLRMLNVQEGLGRDGDAPPEAWFGARGFKDYLTGEPLVPQDVARMTEEYYDEQGWDPATGIPTAPTLDRLGLGHRP